MWIEKKLWILAIKTKLAWCWEYNVCLISSWCGFLFESLLMNFKQTSVEYIWLNHLAKTLSPNTTHTQTAPRKFAFSVSALSPCQKLWEQLGRPCGWWPWSQCRSPERQQYCRHPPPPRHHNHGQWPPLVTITLVTRFTWLQSFVHHHHRQCYHHQDYDGVLLSSLHMITMTMFTLVTRSPWWRTPVFSATPPAWISWMNTPPWKPAIFILIVTFSKQTIPKAQRTWVLQLNWVL